MSKNADRKKGAILTNNNNEYVTLNESKKCCTII